MFVAVSPLVQLVLFLLWVAWFLLLLRVIGSLAELVGWRPPVMGPVRSAYDLIIRVTEFGLRPLRRIVPPVGMFDISVLVAFVIISVAQQVVGNIR
jgi:YggT family protein